MLRDAWMLAIETLSWIELQHLGERLALAKAAKQLEIDNLRVVGLAHKLIFETLRRLNLIDSVLNLQLTPNSLSDFKLGVRSFLRLYTYHVLFKGADFDRAAAMARMGRAILDWRQLNDVEEVLGRILSVKLSDVLKGTTDEERVALQTYSPTWFVKYCFKMLGRSEALNFLESASEPTPTYVRINTLMGAEKECVNEMEKEGVIVQKEPLLKYTYRVMESKRPLTRSQGFRQGLFYVQDKASCLVVEAANPRANDIVLDVCAAPGAKTTYIAQLMHNKGAIHSIDYSRRRINVWKRETKRLGVKIATPIIADAQKPLPINYLADLVVLDPPCTSSGAFGKTPSAKWRLTKNSIFNMAKVQWNMLNNCAEKVKEDGRLVYSTCSISLEENEVLVERFLKWHPEFSLVETTPRIGLPGFRDQSQCQRLYPHLHECNGFFLARLEKTQ